MYCIAQLIMLLITASGFRTDATLRDAAHKITGEPFQAPFRQRRLFVAGLLPANRC